MSLWWHVYGGEIDDLTELPDGSLGAGWGQVTMGESTMPPSKVVEVLPELDVMDASLPYLKSFDHEPTRAEVDALTPEQYRDDGEGS